MPFTVLVCLSLEILSTPNGINLAKLAIQYADGIIMGEENVNQELVDYVNEYKLPILPYEKFDHTDTGSIQRYNTFYDQFIKSSSDVE